MSETSQDFPDVIPLKTGATITRTNIRSYFDGLFKAEKSGEQFPVNLDDVWPFAFMSKGKAKAALVMDATFVTGRDYIVAQVGNNSIGRQAEDIRMTTECMEVVFTRRSRPIFDVYRECRRIVWNMADAAAVKTDLVPVAPSLVQTIEVMLTMARKHEAHEQAITDQGRRIAALEATVTGDTRYMAILGYCNLHDIRLTTAEMAKAGAACSKFCRETGVEIKPVFSEIYGKINAYPIEILDRWAASKSPAMAISASRA